MTLWFVLLTINVRVELLQLLLAPAVEVIAGIVGRQETTKILLHNNSQTTDKTNVNSKQSIEEEVTLYLYIYIG